MDELINNIMQSPENTNPNVLKGQLLNLTKNNMSNVTPEQFGAKGDGITDDTYAIQAAVDSGDNVMFGYGKTYKCGQINVTKNIEIDCCWAQFICTAETLWNISGRVSETINGDNYIANMDYALPDGDDYTGMAFLHSPDNVIPTRNYYYGGWAAIFENGVCRERRPIGFTQVKIDKVDPIVCSLKHIQSITFVDSTNDYNRAVTIKYGLNCVVDGFFITGASCYDTVQFMFCRDCVVEHIYGTSSYEGSVENNYPVTFNGSTGCVLRSSQIHTDTWVCFSIGGNYLCYDNRIENGIFTAPGDQRAIGSHDNAVGTVIRNVKTTGASLAMMGRAENITLFGNAGSLNLTPSSIPGLGRHWVDGVYVVFDEATPTNTTSISVNAFPYEAVENFYVDELTIKNVRTNRNDYAVSYIRACFFFLGDGGEKLRVTGTITIENAVGAVGYTIQASPKMVFEPNSRLLILNCKGSRPDGKACFILGPNGAHTSYPPLTELHNCYIRRMYGTFNELMLYDTTTDGAYANDATGTKLTVYNSSLPGYTPEQTFNSVRAYDMKLSGTDSYIYYEADNGVIKAAKASDVLALLESAINE